MDANKNIMEEFPETIADAVVLETEPIVTETVTETSVVVADETEIEVQDKFTALSTVHKQRTDFIEDFDRYYRAGEMYAKSALVPKNYQGKPADCTIAIDMAYRMGIHPIMVMQNMYVVQGRPSWSGQACIALIKNHFRNARHVYVGTPGNDDWGCYLTATNANGDEIKGSTVTIQMAKKEGWYSKKDNYGREVSKWQSMPEQMLAYRAAAFFARVHCPEILMGCSVEGEPEDIAGSQQRIPINKNPYFCRECGNPFRSCKIKDRTGAITHMTVEEVYKMSCDKNADGVARCSNCMNRLGKAKK